MSKSHAGHSTFSKGKLTSQAFQEPYFRNAGKTILGLVGDGKEGLKRHVEYYRGRGFQNIIIYESDPATARTLYDAKYDHYRNDEGVVIHYGDALQHSFGVEPVNAIDFDSMQNFFYHLVKKVGSKWVCELDPLYTSGTNIISITCSSRIHTKEPMYKLAMDYGIPASSKTKQWIVAEQFLKITYPEYEFLAFPYWGKTCMYNIMAIKKSYLANRL